MYIVADIGGTKMRMAASTDLATFSTDPIVMPTPQDYAEGLGAIVNNARTLSSGEEIQAICLGLPVSFSEDKKTINGATNLAEWSGKHIAADIETKLHTRVFLDNDVVAVGLGEAVHGAGKGAKQVIYITVSTGVNGVYIVDGLIAPDHPGYSTGRQYVSMNDPLTDWEGLISGKAISKKYGIPPKELGKDWAGWEDLARVTAFGVHNSILHWPCDRVVLGGSMFNEIGIPVGRVQHHLQEIMTAYPHIPEIVHSTLVDVGGLYGGLVRLKQLVG